MSYRGTVVYPSGRYPFAAAAALNPGDIALRPDGSLAIYDGMESVAVGAFIEAAPINPCIVCEFIAPTGATWAAGALVYWDAANNTTTTTASGNTLLGRSIAAKTSGQLLTRLVCS